MESGYISLSISDYKWGYFKTHVYVHKLFFQVIPTRENKVREPGGQKKKRKRDKERQKREGGKEGEKERDGGSEKERE